jgi:hypothetical protein
MSNRRDPFWQDDTIGQHDERRARPRYHWALEPFCPLFATLEGYPWPTRVENISTGGISLSLKHRFDLGTLLTVELLNSTKMLSCKLQIRVAYIKEGPDGDWVMGCAFQRELTEEEQWALLS